jgi:hypothetical protein
MHSQCCSVSALTKFHVYTSFVLEAIYNDRYIHDFIQSVPISHTFNFAIYYCPFVHCNITVQVRVWTEEAAPWISQQLGLLVFHIAGTVLCIALC